jgi:hypothetical protein
VASKYTPFPLPGEPIYYHRGEGNTDSPQAL